MVLEIPGLTRDMVAQHAPALRALAERGCLKINLQIAEGNEAVEAFYLGLGFATEVRISMGKPVTGNLHPAESPRDGDPATQGED